MVRLMSAHCVESSTARLSAPPAGLAAAALVIVFLAGGGVVYAQCAPDPNDPVPLEVWDPQCYATCSDPNCANSPSDPNACCALPCTLCLGEKGCLPLAKSISWFDADQDGWPDAFTWYRDPLSSTPAAAVLQRWPEQPSLDRGLPGEDDRRHLDFRPRLHAG